MLTFSAISIAAGSLFEAKDLLVLILMPVAELVVAERVAGLRCVVLLDMPVIADEIAHAMLEDLQVFVDLVELGGVVHELELLDIECDSHAGDGSECE